MPPYVPSALAIAAQLKWAQNLANASAFAGGPWPLMLAGTTPGAGLPQQAMMDAIVSGLLLGWTIENKSVNFAASYGVHYRVDTALGPVIATLPAPDATNAGRDFSFKLLAAQPLTIVGVIDNAVNIVLNVPMTAVTLRSTGTVAGYDII